MILRWYHDIQEILSRESEVWLAYNPGQNLDRIPHLTSVKPRFIGKLFRIVNLVLWVVRQTKFKAKPNISATERYDCLVFSDSANQMTALDGTIDALRDSGSRVLAIANSKYLDRPERNNRYVEYRLGLTQTFRGVVLLVLRWPVLMRSLKFKNPLALRWYLDTFCASYFHLVYFYELLREVQPGYVVTSNDHNVPNRCMLAVAHYLEIKTVYLQHASVGKLFPALRVNYAFLDGQSAFETYQACEANHPGGLWDAPRPKIFLTGQKKNIHRVDSRANSFIGVAVNPLDDPSMVLRTVILLTQAGYQVSLRWHPAQPEVSVQQYRNALKGASQVILSDPKEDPVEEYLERLRYLVAGNTSLILEAAVAGVCPLYFEYQPAAKPDVYGFVEQGLARHIHSSDELLESIQQDRLRINEKAVQHYSATFDTEWEGREGELVATYLMSLQS